MKTKISISINREINDQIDNKLADGLFRNKSHVIEYAVRQFLKNEL